MSENPNPKHQIPNKHEIQNPKDPNGSRGHLSLCGLTTACFGPSNFGFWICLVLGIWNFEFAPFFGCGSKPHCALGSRREVSGANRNFKKGERGRRQPKLLGRFATSILEGKNSLVFVPQGLAVIVKYRSDVLGQ